MSCVRTKFATPTTTSGEQGDPGVGQLLGFERLRLVAQIGAIALAGACAARRRLSI